MSLMTIPALFKFLTQKYFLSVVFIYTEKKRKKLEVSQSFDVFVTYFKIEKIGKRIVFLNTKKYW